MLITKMHANRNRYSVVHLRNFKFLLNSHGIHLVPNLGSMFTLFAVTEALSNLMAAIIFHTLFPLSLNFLSQLSFYILAVLMLIPTVIF